MKRKRKQTKLSPLKNCSQCGRDTKNKSRICSHCFAGHHDGYVPRPTEREQAMAVIYKDEFDENTRDDQMDKMVREALEDMMN